MSVADDGAGPASATVVGVQDDLITMEAPEGNALTKNEVVYIHPRGGNERLQGEVLRVRGRVADVQVFEDTGGVAVGDRVEQTGTLLSVALGPGLLGQVYDGLQNPLEKIAVDHGYFLPRGVSLPALDTGKKWAFTPAVRIGDRLMPGQSLGSVQEGRFQHQIMVPFDARGEQRITWIQEGSFTVDAPVARIADAGGREQTLTMTRTWPVRRAIPRELIRRGNSERLYPEQPLITKIRTIDSFFPVARGGTACIPGPFGAGKTVLQNLIARYAEVDVVIIVACGERAGEVVETITEFPRLKDPVTGGSLMDRTVIICNTSSMPVAAREASIYTGITVGEYYRQMGYSVLLIADSTSRWAQAMRETSGRMEEIPGEEAFPAYLDSAIRGVYERAGLLRNADGRIGSLTLIGTVSPAGGNFEEPVTQSTLGTVKAFLGLSADRAYKRFYPAVDPLLSWSRYRQQFDRWYAENLGEDWTTRIQRLLDLLADGDQVQQMMQVTGEEGITREDFIVQQKAQLLDTVYLQQDAFDPVDAQTELARQRFALDLLDALVRGEPRYETKDEIRQFFNRLTAAFKNWNYAAEDSPRYQEQLDQIRQLAEDAGVDALPSTENSSGNPVDTRG
ncbi:V-type ATP synthase subunit A [Ectothiorhodospiraceae bacterium WFHF3C12]|nr:V-type ATP synthase subunit A [Ectothiorhodospiraceae bacterium WFHF3C12]